MRSSEVCRALERDGYFVAEDVFSPAKVAALREAVGRALAEERRPHNGGIARSLPVSGRTSGPVGRLLLGGERLDRLLREAAAPGAPQLVENANLHADILHDWHVDLTPEAWRWMRRGGSGRVYKVGLYLQAHAGRGGLSVVPGSHEGGPGAGAPRHLDTRPGDVVVFDPSIRHAGRFPNGPERLLVATAWQLHKHGILDDAGRHRFVTALRSRLGLRPRPGRARLAVFLTFATTAAAAERFRRLLADPGVCRREGSAEAVAA